MSGESTRAGGGATDKLQHKFSQLSLPKSPSQKFECFAYLIFFKEVDSNLYVV